MKAFTWQDFNWHATSKLVVLTGAGISAESGIKTFRDSNGLWENHSIEEVATPIGYQKSPKLVTDFYNQRRSHLSLIKPNDAHYCVSRLEELLGDRFFLVTQNVDDLHELAGNKNFVHMHGELLRLKCTRNGLHKISLRRNDNLNFSHEQKCEKCEGIMRPDIVWFGEIPYEMDRIYRELYTATHFVFIGTSSQVYPAANFKALAKKNNAKVLCIDLHVDMDDEMTDFYIQATASVGVMEFLKYFKETD